MHTSYTHSQITHIRKVPIDTCMHVSIGLCVGKCILIESVFSACVHMQDVWTRALKHTHTYARAHTHTLTHTHKHAHTHTQRARAARAGGARAHTHTHTHTHTPGLMYGIIEIDRFGCHLSGTVGGGWCVCLCVCVCVCVCVCTCALCVACTHHLPPSLLPSLPVSLSLASADSTLNSHTHTHTQSRKALHAAKSTCSSPRRIGSS
jgi:hypothetical protein